MHFNSSLLSINQYVLIAVNPRTRDMDGDFRVLVVSLFLGGLFMQNRQSDHLMLIFPEIFQKLKYPED